MYVEVLTQPDPAHFVGPYETYKPQYKWQLTKIQQQSSYSKFGNIIYQNTSSILLSITVFDLMSC